MREFVDVGGLMTYSPSMRASFRRAATYVDKIFNMKVAKTLGLTIPPRVLVRATEVIQ